MKLSTRKYGLQNDILVSINDERNDVRKALVTHNENSLVPMRRILKYSKVFLLKNDLCDFFKRDTTALLEFLVLYFIPENIHNSIYYK